ncbi:MAG: M12 family metallopeptidase [Pseudonocardiaceae bacterium]
MTMRPNLWPEGIVPYVVHPDLPNRQRVTQAITEWNSLDIPVALVPRENQRNYVEFVAAEYSSSRRGCIGGHQKINLSPGFSAGVVLHEIGHAVGLAHEHNRPDRDQYVERICLENIVPDTLAYFQPRPDDDAQLGDYDFESIMHYSQMAFSRNRGRTIAPRMEKVTPGVIIGQRQRLSEGDIRRLNHLYGPGAGTAGDNTGVRTVNSQRPEETYFLRIVRGRIMVPSDAPTVRAAGAVVWIRDLAYSDAPQRQVVAGSSRVVDVAPDVPIGFSVDVPDGTVADGLTPSIEVHIDLDGSGYFSRGDLVSMEPHWVFPATPDAPIDVQVSVI